ncbi:DNA replication/repair protein RecF [Allorhizobium sp. BGMRC 0089]|uniref:DNA replication/repair protein RecF n=1 Tax=Allorhizobium sonneratiae TaxID=2934936 RepID=UPI0020335B63|nr:DNA replication/repair protein RecF [Allorhizobium sonneratiae]MCM2291650.1 DNA replication/repair protein RecF [Allorhizobium sonneratiae]
MNDKTCIARLKLGDFRNYISASLRLDGRHVVLTGTNGSGKTNLMEAVSFLSPGRGLRRAALSDVVRAGAAGGFSIFAEVQGMAGEVELGTGTEMQDETTLRRLRVNGAPVRSLDELTDHLRLIWLTPAMDSLFTGPSSERRRFLDRLVLSIDPGHGRRASDFERAMRSRNRLLAEGRFDPSWLAGIENQMAALGVAMAVARQEMIRLLTGLIDERRALSPFPVADLRLEGFLDRENAQAAIDLEDGYRDRLAMERGRDAAAGRTLEGPHRSDLLVRHRDKAMEAERCSTGEQKALLIGLILAHAELVASMTGFAPILLLDEIAAHLDEGRRAALFDRIDALGGQAFMTGTDRHMFASLGDRAQFITVQDGLLSADENHGA